MIPAGYPGSSKPAVLVPKAGKGKPSSTSVFATQVTETRHTGCYRTKLVITPIGALRESTPGNGNDNDAGEEETGFHVLAHGPSRERRHFIRTFAGRIEFGPANRRVTIFWYADPLQVKISEALRNLTKKPANLHGKRVADLLVSEGGLGRKVSLQNWSWSDGFAL